MSAIRNDGYRDELAKATPGLRRFARALIGDGSVDAADDLVQATLVAALGTERERRGPQLQVWALGTLVSLHRRSVGQSATEELGARHGGVAGGSAAWDGARRGQRKVGPLGRLPLDCREVLLLVTLEKLSYVQTAECLGLTLNAVVSLLTRARDGFGRVGSDDTSAAPDCAPRPRRVPYLRVVQ